MSDDNQLDKTESQIESETVVTNNSNKTKSKKSKMRESCPFCSKIMNAKSMKRHIHRMHNETEEVDHEMDQNEAEETTQIPTQTAVPPIDFSSLQPDPSVMQNSGANFNQIPLSLFLMEPLPNVITNAAKSPKKKSTQPVSSSPMEITKNVIPDNLGVMQTKVPENFVTIHDTNHKSEKLPLENTTELMKAMKPVEVCIRKSDKQKAEKALNERKKQKKKSYYPEKVNIQA